MEPGMISLSELQKAYCLTDQEKLRIRNNATKWGCPATKIRNKIHFPTDKGYILLSGIQNHNVYDHTPKTPEYLTLKDCAEIMGKTTHNFYVMARKKGITREFEMRGGGLQIRTRGAYRVLKMVEERKKMGNK